MVVLRSQHVISHIDLRLSFEDLHRDITGGPPMFESLERAALVSGTNFATNEMANLLIAYMTIRKDISP